MELRAVNTIFTVNGCAVNDFKTVNEIFLELRAVNTIFTVNGCAVNDVKTVNEIFFRRFAPLTIYLPLTINIVEKWRHFDVLVRDFVLNYFVFLILFFDFLFETAYLVLLTLYLPLTAAPLTMSKPLTKFFFGASRR